MIVVNLLCQKCGTNFPFSPADYTLKGLSSVPKSCPKCCDERQGLEKVVVNRRCLEEYICKVVSFPELVGIQAGEKYRVGKFGGREYGKWGGARFDDAYLFYINNSLPENLTGQTVMIRKMEKIWSKGEDQHRSIYFVIDPAPAIDPPSYYLYLIRSWYKTTLKGYGRNRNYSEKLEDGESFSQIELVSVSTRCNSGRFGNNYRLVIADKEVKIIEEGVA